MKCTFRHRIGRFMIFHKNTNAAEQTIWMTNAYAPKPQYANAIATHPETRVDTTSLNPMLKNCRSLSISPLGTILNVVKRRASEARQHRGTIRES